ncbi:MAG TPA: hypothetical protein VF755_22920 [Catenuloplanes sp.]|jgi:ABC-type phosphate transport system substrate-binding protein
MQANTLGRALGVAFCAAISVAAVGTPAFADPTPTGDYRTLTGVGSDTTQDVMGGLSESITDASGAKIIANWNASGASPIKTKATDCEIARPNGSTAGRNALKLSETQGSSSQGCVDFARSSSSTSFVEGGTGTWIPFGVDAMTYAINENSDLPRNLTTVQLERVYQCLTDNIAGEPVVPLLIQPGSGTRAFWNQKVGITETEIANGDYPCLQSLNNSVQEHNGAVLDGHNDYILPYSVAQYIAQSNANTVVGGVTVAVDDRRGTAVLGSVNGIAPRTAEGTLNTELPYRRDVYNIVPTADLGVPVIDEVFTGADSAICTRTNIIQAYGFGATDTCGSTDLTGNL